MKYDDLKSLKELLDEGLVTEKEYEIQKSRILDLPIKSKQDVEEDSDEKNTEESSEYIEDAKVEQEDSNDHVSDEKVESTRESLKDTENNSEKSEDILPVEVTEEPISRIERTSKGNLKQVLLIVVAIVVVFTIGCFLGYQIFK